MRWLLLALLLLLPACGNEDPDGLTVFAAASLAEAFTDLAGLHEDRTGTPVALSFAGSPSLVAQVQQGAPADVVVTADEASMAALADDVTGEPVVLARNALAVVTERGNPRRVAALTDLPRVSVVLGGSAVPVGRAARAALDAAGVRVRPVSEEPDVKAVLGKVRAGEADAGIVYVTDLIAAGEAVDGFRLPGAVNAYPGAAVRGGDVGAARAFLDLVASDRGQAVLARHGFLPP